MPQKRTRIAKVIQESASEPLDVGRDLLSVASANQLTKAWAAIRDVNPADVHEVLFADDTPHLLPTANRKKKPPAK